MEKISKFWKELKRRKVLRSLAIYAGSAFIILEAATIIFPRWGLPDWTIDLVLYLLILGAFINIIVAWIFDITPEGVQKTKAVSEVREGAGQAFPLHGHVPQWGRYVLACQQGPLASPVQWVSRT